MKTGPGKSQSGCVIFQDSGLGKINRVIVFVELSDKELMALFSVSFLAGLFKSQIAR